MSAGGLAWAEAAAFLAGPGLGRPRVIETHTARIHLTATRAWKLRRPVDYGWLDYATRARRRRFSEAEIARNRDAAPGLYLGLGGVAPGPRLLEPGAPVPAEAEPLVVMRRFEDADLFDRMAGAGALDRALLVELGRAVAAMHRRGDATERPVRLPAMIGAETAALADLARTLGEGETRALIGALAAAAERLAPLAAARGTRRCHGDLHLGNIVLWRGHPAPFDAIDFNDDLIEIDPLYDLAFLTMDLRRRGLARHRAAVLNAWAEGLARGGAADEAAAYGGLGLLALYEACRAAIRAKIAGLAGDVPAAQGFAALAAEILAEGSGARLVAVGGRSGSGKSTLARGLADRLGALVLRSDAVRKDLWGVAETERLPSEAYTAEANAAMAATLRRRAAPALAAGWTVVLDATHLDERDRAAARALAAETGAAFTGLWLDAPEAVLAERIAARRGDASDATLAVLRRQMARPAPADWARISAEGPPAAAQAAALALLAPPI